MRSGWGSWGCSGWRRGGWGGTFSLSPAPWQEGAVRGGWSLLPSNQRQDERRWPQVVSGEVQVGYGEKCLYWKSGQALAQAAQGGGGVPISGGVQTPCGCGTWGHGLAGTEVLGWRLDLVTSEIFSNLWCYKKLPQVGGFQGVLLSPAPLSTPQHRGQGHPPACRARWRTAIPGGERLGWASTPGGSTWPQLDQLETRRAQPSWGILGRSPPTPLRADVLPPVFILMYLNAGGAADLPPGSCSQEKAGGPGRAGAGVVAGAAMGLGHVGLCCGVAP